jgi:hypothetical protein
MELGSDATFQEERVEVLASVRDALRTSGRDPGLRAAAGFLLRHLASAGLVSQAPTGAARVCKRWVPSC